MSGIGADLTADYLTKPIDPERMLDLIRRCLAERKQSGPHKSSAGGSLFRREA